MSEDLVRFLSGDKSMLRCTVCDAQAGTCDCWTKCRTPGCTWSYRTGTSCPNCTRATPSLNAEIAGMGTSS